MLKAAKNIVFRFLLCIRHLNVSFLALLVFIVCINLPNVKFKTLPLIDTSVAFEMFHFFYNEFHFNKVIAQWLPYYSYGIPSQYWQLFSLTPVNYLFILVGGIWKIENTLILFNLSLFAEQLIFLLGVYLLSKILFTRKSTSFLVSLSAIFHLTHTPNIFADFRLCYMFPWAAFFMVLFFYGFSSSFSYVLYCFGKTKRFGNAFSSAQRQIICLLRPSLFFVFAFFINWRTSGPLSIF